MTSEWLQTTIIGLLLTIVGGLLKWTLRTIEKKLDGSISRMENIQSDLQNHKHESAAIHAELRTDVRNLRRDTRNTG